MTRRREDDPETAPNEANDVPQRTDDAPKLRYSVLGPRTIVDGKEYAVGDVVEMTEADFIKSRDHGLLLAAAPDEAEGEAAAETKTGVRRVSTRR